MNAHDNTTTKDRPSKSNGLLRNPNNKIIGLVVKDKDKYFVKCCNLKSKPVEINVRKRNLNDARQGDFVVLKFDPEKNVASVERRIGREDTPGILSLLSAYEKDIRVAFSDAVLNEIKDMKKTNALTVPGPEGREDLRKVKVVTIDPKKAGDYDDGVYTEPDLRPGKEGGDHIIVTIADVANYVDPGSESGKEALLRGNSTYLPELVVPMFHPELSDDLCSLKPHVDRACIAHHLWIDKDGNLTEWERRPALMNSAARLTYEQVQAARDGNPDAMTAPLMEQINRLYDVYEKLKKATQKRGAMDLDRPEPEIVFNDKGEITDIKEKYAIPSNNLIAEFMILANIAAGKDKPPFYRVHEAPPSAEKIANLREYLGLFNMTLPAGDLDESGAFNGVIKEASKLDKGLRNVIMKMILSAQSKAKYSTDNIGHNGLGLVDPPLDAYAQVTSPIRRAEDFVDQYFMTKEFNKAGAVSSGGVRNMQMEEIAKHISQTEIQSKEAEYAANDRYTAKFLSKKVGEKFKARIAGISKAGLHILLDGTGAECLMPMRSLPGDYYEINEGQQTLTGHKNKILYRTGAPIMVELTESNEWTGSMVVKPVDDKGAEIPGLKAKKISAQAVDPSRKTPEEDRHHRHGGHKKAHNF
ncbi:MAG: ribonuclease R family protein [Pseudomonadota bacterium]